MPTAMICSDGGNHITELMQSLSSLGGWDLHLHDVQKDHVEKINPDDRNIDLHYLIYTAPINQTVTTRSKYYPQKQSLDIYHILQFTFG